MSTHHIPDIGELSITHARREIVFVASNVADIDTLIQAMGTAREVIVFDASGDGLRQMLQALEGRSGIDALHIVTHGSPGQVALGSLLLDQATLAARASDVEALGKALVPGGDVLFYGCDVGAGSNGAALLDELAIVTGRDVAASSDRTGAASLGGDWELEVQRGDIETAPVVDPKLASLYQHTLAVPSLPIVIDFSDTSRMDPDSVKPGFPPFYGRDPGVNLIYKVGGDSNYEFMIDGADQSAFRTVGPNSDYAYAIVSSDSDETAITLSFVKNQPFTLSSIGLENYDGSHSVTLRLTGYDSDGILKESTSVFLQSLGGVENVDLASLGMTLISKLVITVDPSSPYSKIPYLRIDDIVFEEITPLPPPPPKVTGVTSDRLNGTLKAGDIVDIKVTFDADVQVTGTPTLKMANGGTGTDAVYVSGGDTNTLVFRYTVAAGDTIADLDYASTTALSLNGGTITRAGEQAAVLTLPTPGSAGSLGANKNFVIDGIAPTVTITSSTGTSTLKAGQTATITFTFSEDPGSSFTLSDVILSGGTAPALMGTGATRTMVFTPSANQTGTARINVAGGSYADAAGNPGAAASQLSLTFDTQPPGKPAVPTSLQGNVTNVSTPRLMGSGAEANTTVTIYQGVSELTQVTADAYGFWEYLLPSQAQGTHAFTVTYSDAAGNISVRSDALNITIDTTAPTVSAVADIGSGFVKAGATTTITFTFSEDPGATFTKSDLVVTGGTVGDVTGSGTTRTVTFTPLEGSSGEARVKLAAGTYKDAAGNNGAAMADLVFNYDTEPPAKPAAPISLDGDFANVAKPRLQGTGVEAGGSVIIYNGTSELGTVEVAAGGAWTYTPTSALAEGTYNFSVVYLDAAGNASVKSDTLSVTIDTTPPTQTIGSLVMTNDSGVTGDFVTNQAGVQLQGTLSAALGPGERVLVSTDGGSTYAQATVSGTSWTFDATLAGAGQFQVVVQDQAGNKGTPLSQNYVFDNVAPSAPSTPDMTAASDTGLLDNDNITANTQPTFTGTAENGSTVKLYIDGAVVGQGTAHATTGAWTITLTNPISADGTYEIVARATDVAGNEGPASLSLPITIRTTPPSTGVTAIALSSDTGTANDNITRDAAQTLAITVGATLAAGEKVQVSVDGGTTWLDATLDSGTSYSRAVTLVAGENAILGRVVNDIGMGSTPHSHSYTLWETPPTVTVTSDKASLRSGEQATLTFTFDRDPGDSFTIGGASPSVTVSGGTLSNLGGTGLIRTATFTPTEGANNGSVSLALTANAFVDVAGNIGTLVSPALTIGYDTLAPAKPAAPALGIMQDTGWSNTDGVTMLKTPEITGSAEAGTTITVYDQNDAVVGSGAASGGTYWITLDAFADGPHSVYVVATDLAGNRSAKSEVLNFTVDTTAPTVTITSEHATLKAGQTTELTFTFSEDPGTTFTSSSIMASGGSIGAITGTGLTRVATFTPMSGFDAGTASISLMMGFTDLAGNAGVIAGTPWSLTYDTLAPIAPLAPALDATTDTGTSNSDRLTTATLPKLNGFGTNGELITLYGRLEGTATWSVIGTATVVNGEWSVTATTALEQGRHEFRATATDLAGNESLPSSTTTVTIVTEGPNISLANIGMTNDSGQSPTDFITNVTSGHVLSGTLSAPLASGEFLQVSSDNGVTWDGVPAFIGTEWSHALDLASSGTIIVRAVNYAGATTTLANRAYVIDTVAPTVTLSADKTALKIGEKAVITLTFSEDPGTSFTMQDLTVSGGTLGNLSGTGLTRTVEFTPTNGVDAGTASVSVAAGTFTDLAGNANSAATPLTISYDTLAPSAPVAPGLAAASDTGTVGDGITEETQPVFEGKANPSARVELLNGTTVIGTATADASGNWSVTPATALGYGNYTLTVVQLDAAGNRSAASAPLNLTISAPPVVVPPVDPTPPIPLIDGVPVVISPVTLPGGVPGTSVLVPVVPGGREETSGVPGVADIPLLQNPDGTELLLAQLPVGIGLSASGANMGRSNMPNLIAAIQAVTPTHAPTDQGHLTGNGQGFLDQLAASNLVVETVNVIGGGTNAPLTLTGTSTGTQGTAIVLDASAAPGAQVVTNGVNFVVVIGQASLTSNTTGAMLTGDDASQQFSVSGGNGGQVFAGGGADLLRFNANINVASFEGVVRAQTTQANPTILHAGQGWDVASFNGKRADWNIEEHQGYVVVSSKLDPSARALVVNAEMLQFDDVSISTAPNLEHNAIAALYTHIMGRQADIYGFEWWANTRAAGNDWGHIAMGMINSSERANGFNGDSAHDIELLYQALFNRSVDAGGLAYWQARMEEGLTLQDLAKHMVESSEMVGYYVAPNGWDFLV